MLPFPILFPALKSKVTILGEHGIMTLFRKGSGRIKMRIRLLFLPTESLPLYRATQHADRLKNDNS